MAAVEVGEHVAGGVCEGDRLQTEVGDGFSAGGTEAGVGAGDGALGDGGDEGGGRAGEFDDAGDVAVEKAHSESMFLILGNGGGKKRLAVREKFLEMERPRPGVGEDGHGGFHQGVAGGEFGTGAGRGLGEGDIFLRLDIGRGSFRLSWRGDLEVFHGLGTEALVEGDGGVAEERLAEHAVAEEVHVLFEVEEVGGNAAEGFFDFGAKRLATMALIWDSPRYWRPFSMARAANWWK